MRFLRGPSAAHQQPGSSAGASAARPQPHGPLPLVWQLRTRGPVKAQAFIEHLSARIYAHGPTFQAYVNDRQEPLAGSYQDGFLNVRLAQDWCEHVIATRRAAAAAAAVEIARHRRSRVAPSGADLRHPARGSRARRWPATDTMEG